MAEWRKITETVGETGVGVEDRTETRYQLGADYNGVFVPAITLPENTFTAALERAKADAAATEPAAETETATEPEPEPEP